MNMWIVTANRLSDGGVVYLDSDRAWTTDVRRAARSEQQDASALEWAAAQEHVICDPYPFEVRIGEGGDPEPLSARERIRAEGPTPTLVRLGYAADAPTHVAVA